MWPVHWQSVPSIEKRPVSTTIANSWGTTCKPLTETGIGAVEALGLDRLEAR